MSSLRVTRIVFFHREPNHSRDTRLGICAEGYENETEWLQTRNIDIGLAKRHNVMFLLADERVSMAQVHVSKTFRRSASNMFSNGYRRLREGVSDSFWVAGARLGNLNFLGLVGFWHSFASTMTFLRMCSTE